jgi:ribose/xylose/arabinose/galactoside ABC-type transport system permease subunit
VTTSPSASVATRLLNPALALPSIVLAIVVFGALTTPDFFNADNARAVLINASVVGVVAVGMTPVTLSGNFISLGAQQSTMLAAIVFLYGISSGWGFGGTVLLLLVLMLAVGLLQGLIVAAGLNPIITTLAAGSIIYGTVTILTDGKVVTDGGADLAWLGSSAPLGIPTAVYVFVAFTAIMTFAVDRTTIGRRLILTGANRLTAGISGISARITTVWAFLALSLGCLVAGVLLGAQLGQATSSDLETLTTDVVAAVLVGGTAIQGGEGSPLRSAVGAVIIALLSNVMLLHDASTGTRLTVTGLLVVIVVAALQLLRRRSR